MCYLLTYENQSFSYTEYVVQNKETVSSIAAKFTVNDYMLRCKNKLYDDYGYLNISQPFRGINEGTKRKTVYPDDLLKYYKVWDKKLLKVFDRIPKMNQPLLNLITKDLWNEIDAISQGKKEMRSILNNYYKSKE